MTSRKVIYGTDAMSGGPPIRMEIEYAFFFASFLLCVLATLREIKFVGQTPKYRFEKGLIFASV